MLLNKLSIVLILPLIVACSASRKKGSEQQTTKEQKATPSKIVDYTGPSTIVYKTTKDYSKNVAITLSDDGKTIAAYPAPGDVYYKGNLAYPTELTNGYLLDNRGLNANSVFTKYTYEEYSKLTVAPDANTLLLSIIDKNPIVEMYNCGNRYSNKEEVNELNTIIKNNELTNYKKVK